MAARHTLFICTTCKRGPADNPLGPGFIDSLPKKDGIAETVPMRRYGRMEEVSELIAFLASPRAGYITGQNIRIDGGITRSV